MKVFSMFTVIMALSASILSADISKTNCQCKDCRCTAESHCGCFSEKGCHCKGGQCKRQPNPEILACSKCGCGNNS